MDKLKHCPFCGTQPTIEQFGRNGLEIKCHTCQATMKQRTLVYGLDWLRNKIIDNWNNRVQEET